MTLVLAVMCRETIWLLTDCRLTSRGKIVKEDARKVMTLETTDGIALLGYAGLGATALGTEPSDWMSSVLRGRNMPLERSLHVLANAAQQQLPRHLRRAQIGHSIIVPAFVGDGFRLYAIQVDPQKSFFRYSRVGTPLANGRMVTPRFAVGGTGGMWLLKNKHRWMRPLLNLVRTHERGVLSAHAVADQLAKLNFDVHGAMTDQSVGSRSIVIWRHAKTGRHRGGGSHCHYSGTKRDGAPLLPTIMQGGDLGAIMSIFAPPTMKAMLEWADRGAFQGAPFQPPDEAAVNEALSKLPRDPDESLK